MTENRSESLISRALDRAATPGEWSELEARAQEEPALWERLGRTLQAQALVDAVARPQIRRADGVEAPRPRARRAPATWAGWAAALLLAVGWTLESRDDPAGAGRDTPATAGMRSLVLDADDALRQYRDHGAAEGRILRELPRQVLHVQPAGDGTAVVEYLRRFHEREVVDGLYRIEEDDAGRPIPVRVSATPVRKGNL